MLDDEGNTTWVDVRTTVDTDGGGAGIAVIGSTKVVVDGTTLGDSITVVGGGAGKGLGTGEGIVGGIDVETDCVIDGSSTEIISLVVVGVN